MQILRPPLSSKHGANINISTDSFPYKLFQTGRAPPLRKGRQTSHDRRQQRRWHSKPPAKTQGPRLPQRSARQKPATVRSQNIKLPPSYRSHLPCRTGQRGGSSWRYGRIVASPRRVLWTESDVTEPMVTRVGTLGARDIDSPTPPARFRLRIHGKGLVTGTVKAREMAAARPRKRF